MVRKYSLFVVCLLFSACSFAQDRQTSFQSFWDQFRAGVLSGDKAYIADLTQFPFETRGPDDGDPIRYYERKRFIKLYDRLMRELVYKFDDRGKLVNKTMRAVIQEKTRVIDRDIPSDDLARVENFEFKRLKGQWRFVRAYTEER
jgi:hypothetical protein